MSEITLIFGKDHTGSGISSSKPKSITEKFAEEIQSIVSKTMNRFKQEGNGSFNYNVVVEYMVWFNAKNIELYFSHCYAIEAIRFLKVLYDNVEQLDFPEYASFLKLLMGRVRWISTDLTLNMMLRSTAQNFKNPKIMVDFVRFIADVILNYDDDVPSKDEWLEEISKGDCFELPASIVIPLMIDGDREHSKREYNTYGYVELITFRKQVARID